MHPRRGLAALAGMRFVDQQREALAGEVAQLIKDEREFLHCRDDDLLATAQILTQLLRVVGVAEDRRHVVVPLDGAGDLRVQRAPVGDDDDGVELRSHRIVLAAQLHQLVRQPSNRVALATACRMLNQVTLTHPIGMGTAQQRTHRAQLMEAREDLLAPLAFLAAGVCFFLHHHLRVALDDVGQRLTGQHLLPQVIGLQTIRVGRVACAAVPALVERQKPRGLTLQLSAERGLRVIDCDVRHATPQLEQQLLWVACGLVLDDGVGQGLLGQRILQLKRQYRQTVDEDHQIQFVAGIVAVAHLPGDAKDVLAEGIRCGGIARRGQQLVEIDVYGPVAHALAQHVHHAALGDLALQPVQELGALNALRRQLQRFYRLGACSLQEGQQLRHIQRHVAVVVGGLALHVAVVGGGEVRGRQLMAVLGLRHTGQAAYHARLEPALAGVSLRHRHPPLRSHLRFHRPARKAERRPPRPPGRAASHAHRFGR